MTTGNVRPATMERITTAELAQQFIEEQIQELTKKYEDLASELAKNREKDVMDE